MTTRSTIALVLIATVVATTSFLVCRSPVADVGVLDARVSALETKLDSMMKAAEDAHATTSSVATRTSDATDVKVAGDAVTALARRLADLASRLDALDGMVKSVTQLDVGGKGWKSKNPPLVDEVARSSRNDPETAVARLFMMPTRQVYELLGMPDHRTFDGEAGQVCTWHYKTGIDGTCLIVTFVTNMATRVDTLPCTLADDELKDWIKEWVRRK